MFFAVGLTLWLPLTFRVKWTVVALQHLAWIIGAAIVLMSRYRMRDLPDGSDATDDPSMLSAAE